MKVKEGFILKKMGNQAVVVSVGSASKIFNGMIKLNESGELMWNKLTQGATKEELVEAILEEYDITEDIASSDVDRFIETLKKPGILGE